MATVFKSFREESRKNYGQHEEENVSLCGDQVKLGALLRIADAIEVISKNHQELIDERDRYKKNWLSRFHECGDLRRQIAGLRGYITRLKKR